MSRWEPETAERRFPSIALKHALDSTVAELAFWLGVQPKPLTRRVGRTMFGSAAVARTGARSRNPEASGAGAIAFERRSNCRRERGSSGGKERWGRAFLGTRLQAECVADAPPGRIALDFVRAF